MMSRFVLLSEKVQNAPTGFLTNSERVNIACTKYLPTNSFISLHESYERIDVRRR